MDSRLSAATSALRESLTDPTLSLLVNETGASEAELRQAKCRPIGQAHGSAQFASEAEAFSSDERWKALSPDLQWLSIATNSKLWMAYKSLYEASSIDLRYIAVLTQEPRWLHNYSTWSFTPLQTRLLGIARNDPVIARPAIADITYHEYLKRIERNIPQDLAPRHPPIVCVCCPIHCLGREGPTKMKLQLRLEDIVYDKSIAPRPASTQNVKASAIGKKDGGTLLPPSPIDASNLLGGSLNASSSIKSLLSQGKSSENKLTVATSNLPTDKHEELLVKTKSPSLSLETKPNMSSPSAKLQSIPLSIKLQKVADSTEEADPATDDGRVSTANLHAKEGTTKKVTGPPNAATSDDELQATAPLLKPKLPVPATPLKTLSIKAAPTIAASVKAAPTTAASVKAAPAIAAPAKAAPAKAAPAKAAPAKAAPAKAAPAKAAPAKAAPIQEAPVEVTPSKVMDEGDSEAETTSARKVSAPTKLQTLLKKENAISAKVDPSSNAVKELRADETSAGIKAKPFLPKLPMLKKEGPKMT